jgi:hypothetical protein
MDAISLNDVESAAIRSLLGCRTLSKPGLAVNSTTNTYTLTLGGTKQTDDIITVNVSVNGATAVTATYTTLVGDADLDAVATKVEVQVEALTGVESTVSGSVVSIRPATTTDAIVVTAAVTKAAGTPTTTATVAQTIIGSKGIKTGNTFQFVLNGHNGSQTTQTNVALTGTTIPVSSFKWWLAVIDSSGTVTAVEGTNGKNVLPEIPDGKVPIGAVKIATNSSVTFIPGVTSLNLTGITDTYYDLSCVPAAGYPA